MKPLFKIVVLLFFLVYTPAVLAHPIDEIGGIKTYDQKHTLSITPQNTVGLKIDMTFYPLEKPAVWESIDTNRDKTISEDEKKVWMHKGENSSYLTKDDKRLPFTATNVSVPDYFDFFASKPAVVSITFSSSANVSLNDRIDYHYEGTDKTLQETTLDLAGNKTLSLEKNSQTDTRVTLQVVTDTKKTNPAEIESNDRINAFLNTYIKPDRISLQFLFFAFGISFILGALHAATPGHGKALVAGYLVGERGTIWHAIQLGVIITITHTLSVFVLGIASVVATQYFVAQTIIVWLNRISALLIILFGFILLASRFKHLYQHRFNGHTHTHNEKIDLSWRNILALGVSGGITPCVDALAILVVAASLQKLFLGIVLLVFFSLGLASMLVGVGIFVVLSKHHLTKKLSLPYNFEYYISIVSAIVVILLGILLLFS